MLRCIKWKKVCFLCEDYTISFLLFLTFYMLKKYVKNTHTHTHTYETTFSWNYHGFSSGELYSETRWLLPISYQLDSADGKGVGRKICNAGLKNDINNLKSVYMRRSSLTLPLSDSSHVRILLRTVKALVSFWYQDERRQIMRLNQRKVHLTRK